MANNYAKTSRMALQHSIQPPWVNSPSLALPGRCQPCAVKPNFPTADDNDEPVPNYCNNGDLIVDTEARPTSGKHEMMFEYVTHRQMVGIAEASFHGGVEPPAPSGTKYTYVHNSASNDAQSLLNIEVDVPMGSSGQNFTRRMLSALVESWEVEGVAQNTFITCKISTIGDEPDSPASASALIAETADGRLKFANLAVYVDDTPGAIGSTRVSCNVLSFKISMNNNVETTQTDCGQITERDKRTAMLELRLLLNPITKAQFDAGQSRTLKYVRIEVTDPDTSEVWRWEQVCKFREYSHGEEGVFQDVTLMSQSLPDATLGYSWQQTVIVDNMSYADCQPVIRDTFTDSDATAVASHTPDHDQEGGGWAGTGITVESNALEMTTGTEEVASIDAGLADPYAQAQITLAGVADDGAGLVLNYVDASNYMRARLSGTAQQIVIESVVAGTPASVATVALTLVASTAYLLEVRSLNGTMTAQVGSVSASGAIPSALQVGESVGIYFGAQNHSVDDFVVA